MNHHLIFYNTTPHGKQKTDQPYAAIKLTKTTITLHGPQQFINQWVNYFNNPNWQKHLKQPNPLQNLTPSNPQTHTPPPQTAETDYQNTLKKLPPQTKTKTITL
jgi:hypothetical protein